MNKLSDVFMFLKARLAEPSSLASISVVMAMLGVNVDTAIIHDWVNVGALVFGVLGFFVAESKPLIEDD